MKNSITSLVLKRILQFRLEKSWCQEAMADALGTCQSNYSCLESGRHSMSLEQFLKICNVLDKKPIDFFDEVDSMTQF